MWSSALAHHSPATTTTTLQVDTSLSNKTSANCANPIKCQHQKRLLRRELHQWQRKIPLLVGLETLLSTSLGFPEGTTSSSLNPAEVSSSSPVDQIQMESGESFCLCEPASLAGVSFLHSSATLDEPPTPETSSSSSSLTNGIPRRAVSGQTHETSHVTVSTSETEEQFEPLDLSGFTAPVAHPVSGLPLGETSHLVSPHWPQILGNMPSVSANLLSSLSTSSSANPSAAASFPPPASPPPPPPSVTPEDEPIPPTTVFPKSLSKSAIPPGGKRIYTEKELTQAVRAICSGHLGTRRAAAVFGIPRSTLRNKICKLHDMKRKEELATGKVITLAEMISNVAEESSLFQVNCRRQQQETSSTEPGGKSKKPPLGGGFEEMGLKVASPSEEFSDSLPECRTVNGKAVPSPTKLARLMMSQPSSSSSSSVTLDPPQSMTNPVTSLLDSTSGVVSPQEVSSLLQQQLMNSLNGGQLFEAYLHMTQQFLLPFLPQVMSAFLEQMFPPEKCEALLEALSKQQSSLNAAGIQAFPRVATPPDPNPPTNLKSSPFSVNNLLSNAAVAAAAAASFNLGGTLRGNDLQPCTSSSSSTPSTLHEGVFPTFHNGHSSTARSLQKTRHSTSPAVHSLQQPLPGGEVLPIEPGDASSSSLAGSGVTTTGTSSKNRSKRGHYRRYNSLALQEAVKAVQSGKMSVHKAGSHFGVPHSTLEYKVKERHLLKAKKRLLVSTNTESVPLVDAGGLNFHPNHMAVSPSLTGISSLPVDFSRTLSAASEASLRLVERNGIPTPTLTATPAPSSVPSTTLAPVVLTDFHRQ